MTISTRLITVFGATGNQGGAVVRSLLQNPSFKVRALTRNPASAASQNLASKGAEIHEANGFSSESMLKAFSGSWGVFVNINSDDEVIPLHHSPFEAMSHLDSGIQARWAHGIRYGQDYRGCSSPSWSQASHL